MKVISGGQTGIDQLGLTVARLNGLPTGGYAPKGWLTEDGPQREILEGFGLVECPTAGYPARTRLNVQSSDGTIWFGTTDSTGYRCTWKEAHRLKKPWLENPISPERIVVQWLMTFGIQTLNVAGNRGSKCTVRFLVETGLLLENAFQILKKEVS